MPTFDILASALAGRVYLIECVSKFVENIYFAAIPFDQHILSVSIVIPAISCKNFCNSLKVLIVTNV